MLNEENDEFSDPIFAALYKQSLKIDEDLEFQFSIKREFHHEELCGWTVNECDFNKSKWNLVRKVPKTPNKETKTIKRCFSRQNGYRSDIEFDFKHYQQRINYIEQYRNDKIKRQDPGLSDILSQSNNNRIKSDVCDQCIGPQAASSCEKSENLVPKLEQNNEKSSAVASRNTNLSCQASQSSSSSGLFQGRRLFSRPVFRHGGYGSRETNWKEIIDSSTANLHNHGALYRQPVPSPGMEESWTIIGVEKRPLPQRMKRTNLYTARKETSNKRYQKYSTNKCDAWVKNREQDLGGPYGCESFRITPRSNSAPNMYNSRQSLWKGQDDSKRINTSLSENKNRNTPLQSSSSKMDYSCYTEMFKNVLDYYGPKKLKPKGKLPTTTENGRLLSVKT